MITKLLALVIQYILLYRSVSQSNTIKFCKKHLRKTEGLIASFFIYSSKFITIGALFFYLLYIYLLIHQQNNPHSINTTPLETWTPGDILSFLLIVLGSTLRIYSIQTLGHYFTCNVEILKDHKLVTTGPYKYIRHPSYSGGIMLSFVLCQSFFRVLEVLSKNLVPKEFGEIILLF